MEQLFDLHADADTRLGSVHLKRAYRTTVDPRLSCEQALEMAMLIVHKRG
jgi:3-deoxy-D-arabino-heptulosonate 7-phosphate (DAHP) synthase class II